MHHADSAQFVAWQPFYIAVVTVAATLAGLMAVALTLHIKTLRDRSKRDLLQVAEHSFTDFVLVILSGLFLVMPYGQLTATGWLIIAFNFAALGWIITSLPLLFKTFTSGVTSHRRYTFVRLSFSLTGRSLFIVGAIILVTGAAPWRNAEGWLLAGTITLLVNAVRSGWFLIVHELPGHAGNE